MGSGKFGQHAVSHRALWCVALFVVGGCGEPDPAGIDSGSEDAGPVLCASDTDCGDSIFCNGIERCDPSATGANGRGCVAAASPCMTGQTCEEAEARCVTTCGVSTDADGDGAIALECGGDDCDDSDARAHPGAAERCDPDHLDEDCNPATTGALDRDADGWEDAACCNDRGDGVLACGDDCNDLERTVGPTSGEVCDGFDNDCDGAIDETVEVRGFRDADADLHGDPAMPITGCPGDARFSAVDDDCDDDDRQKHGSQAEACNGVDDDCDGTIDEATAALTWYRDADGDGFGDPASTTSSCTPPAGHSLLALDCDDTDPTVSPFAPELCNGRDDDCNGRADFAVGRGDYEDDDHDGHPDAACSDDVDAADCDDRNPDVYPRAPELIDGVDNDCDATADDVCRDASWYLDADGDGHGDGASEPMRACEPIAGRAPRDGDCDDADPARSPSQREICNAIDDDCDGATDETSDGLCFLDHAIGECAAGTCAIDRCGKGWRDCNTMDGDGCEISIATDAANCGTCGMACAAGAHGLAACTSGRCGLTCEEGYGDCNGLTSDGCESDVYDDLFNCGVCGRVCSNRPNAVRDCRLGACVADCSVGYADCNGDITNGCEVMIGRDAANCGACGVTCGTAGEICVDRSCETPLFASTGAEGALAPLPGAGVVVLTPGVHHFTTITIPDGVTVTTTGSGVLDLRASGDVVIAGTIDVSGSRGGFGGGSDSGGGGASGTPFAPGIDFDGTSASSCSAPGGAGGSGAPGGQGVRGNSEADCSLGGAFGGGAGGLTTRAGGGGGGHAGGGGGMDYQGRAGGAGGATFGNTGGVGGSGSGATCVYPGGGIAPGAYRGQDAPGCSGGGGGSIGDVAAADLAVATTLRAGSGGGGAGGSYTLGSGGGGGGGGALRIASPTRIELTSAGALRADGGIGGRGGQQPGGGGSGGVVFLAAPAMQIEGQISAVGGPGGPGMGGVPQGGAGGLGRVRLSVLQEECTMTGAISPAPISGCAPSTISEHPYIARYPN